MSAEIEALKRLFAAINRNDMQSTPRDFDPQIVRIEPEGFPTTGIHRGIREVQEHIAKGRGSRAEGTCTQADDRVRPKYKSALRIAIRAALWDQAPTAGHSVQRLSSPSLDDWRPERQRGAATVKASGAATG